MDFFMCLHRMRPEREARRRNTTGEEGAERLIPTGSLVGPQKKKGACSAAPMHSFPVASASGPAQEPVAAGVVIAVVVVVVRRQRRPACFVRGYRGE